MRVTGYSNGNQWTGQREFRRDAADFFFWSWIHNNRRLLPPVMEESFVPDLKALVAAVPHDEPLEPPVDGLYLNRESKGPFVAEAITALLRTFGEHTIKDFYPSRADNPTKKLMAVFCRGAAEIFLIQNGQCTYFGAVGENEEAILQHLRLLQKRLSS